MKVTQQYPIYPNYKIVDRFSLCISKTVQSFSPS